MRFTCVGADDVGNFDDIGTGVVEEVAAIAAAVWSLVTSARNASILSFAVVTRSIHNETRNKSEFWIGRTFLSFY